MTDVVKCVFVAGTLGLAAATNTVGTLFMAGAFAYGVFIYTASNGEKRIRLEALDREAELKRKIAFMDRFLNEDAYVNTKAPWGTSEEALLRSMFAVRDTTTDSYVTVKPTWDMLVRNKQEAEGQLDTLKDLVRARVPANRLAAGLGGGATFLRPLLGVAIIGYQVWRNHQLDLRRELRAMHAAQTCLENERAAQVQKQQEKEAAQAKNQQEKEAKHDAALKPGVQFLDPEAAAQGSDDARV